jgi:thiol:disulfide interchange protein
VWTGAFLLCLAVSCWILGQWVDLRSSSRQRLLGWVVAAALTIAGYSTFLRPLLEMEQALAAAVPQIENELPWQPFSVARVESLVAADQNVFINFTAEWCWTCKVNERTVLTDAAVRAKFAQMDMALVKADWTNPNPEIAALLQAFGRSGVPLYVILPAGQADQPLILPEIITTGILLEKLEEAAAVSRQTGS